MTHLARLLLLPLIVAGAAACGRGPTSTGTSPPPAPSTPAAYTFRAGAIIHHWLAMPMERVRGASNVPHTYAASWFAEEDVAWLAEHGFDHLVLLVDTDLWLAEGAEAATLDAAKLAPFEQALAWAARHGLGVIAQLRAPGPIAKRVAAWRAIAERFAAVDTNQLRFLMEDLALDEQTTMAVVNDYGRQVHAAVRAASPERFLYITAPIRVTTAFVADEDTSFTTLAGLWLPDDARTGVSAVYSEPEAFTWQQDRAAPVRFPGRAGDRVLTRDDIDADFARLAAWRRGAGAGRETYLSFFGMHDPADAVSVRTYIAGVVDAARRNDTGWAVFDYESAYAIRDAAGAPTAMYHGLGLAKRGAAAPAFTYARGLLVAHWLGGIAPRYPGQSNVLHTYAAPWFDDEDVRWIADRGFDHLFVPVDATEWVADGKLVDAKVAPFEKVLATANAAGLGVILRYEAPADHDNARVAREWGLVAERFAPAGDGLRFHAGDTDTEAPALSARFRGSLAAVRAASPERYFYLSTLLGDPGDAATRKAFVAALDLGSLDARVGVSFYYWEPAVFTQQFTPLPSPPVPFPGVVPRYAKHAVPPGSYGGADEMNALAKAAAGKELRVEDVVDDLAQIAGIIAAASPGRDVYLYEFGLMREGDATAGKRYLGVVTGAARALGIGWTLYDYESGRAIRNADGSASPLLEGLGLVER
jgi:hypothetical protein